MKKKTKKIIIWGIIIIVVIVGAYLAFRYQLPQTMLANTPVPSGGSGGGGG